MKASKIQLSLSNIDNALKSNEPYFHMNETMLAIIEEATESGYVRRLSHTQAEWTEDGLKRARTELIANEINLVEELMLNAKLANAIKDYQISQIFFVDGELNIRSYYDVHPSFVEVVITQLYEIGYELPETLQVNSILPFPKA